MKRSLIQKMLDHPTGLKLFALNQMLKFIIPFNSAHGIRLISIHEKEVRAILPKRRRNLNHIQSIHACAIATVGEFCAGMSLLQSFPSSEFRLILSNLKVEYLYQGRTDLTGSIQTHPGFIAAAKDEIQLDGKSMMELETLVTDTAKNVVAKVQTTWQIKLWNQVKTVALK